MEKLAGTWKYQSYRPEPGSLTADLTPPRFVRWSPPGVATVEPGDASGTLEFSVPLPTPLKLTLKIQVMEGSPDRLSISAETVLQGEPFTNELQGWFVPATLGEDVGTDAPRVIRGSIVQTSKFSPDKQPIYTTGFFVLERQG